VNNPTVSRLAGAVVVAGPVPDRPTVCHERPDTLAALADAAERAAAGAARLVVLAGERGAGKTQLAAEFARRAIAQRWPVVAWLDAALIVPGLAELASAAGIVGRLLPDDAARAAVHWLRRQPGPCLLVVDSVEDLATVEPWLPGGGVRVVVTTAHPMDINDSITIDVPPLPTAAAVRYLADCTGRSDPALAATVATELGHSPLALAHAAAVIGKRRPFRHYGAYLDRLRALDDGAVDDRAPSDGVVLDDVVLDGVVLDDGSRAPIGVARALRVAIEALRVADPAGDAIDLLRILSVLDPLGVEVATLTADPDPELDKKVRNAIALLVERSLATLSGGGRILRVHRLVQLLVRAELTRTGLLKDVVSAAAAIVDAARPVGDPEDPSIWPQCARLLPHALAVGDPAGETVGFLARWLGVTGRHQEAIAILTSTIGAQVARYGPDRPATLSARGYLALFTGQAGDHHGALQQLQRLLPDLERVLGLGHPATLAARGNLAILTWQAGQTEAALAQVQRLLLDLNRELGADHPVTLQARNNRARFTGQSGDHAAAMHQFTLLLPDMRRVLGADHPDTLALRANLALVTGQSGDLDGAIAQYRQLLPDLTRVLGRDHPATLHARGNLALCTARAGALEPATQQLQRLVADLDRVLGPDHPDTRSARESLAWLLRPAAAPDHPQ